MSDAPNSPIGGSWTSESELWYVRAKGVDSQGNVEWRWLRYHLMRPDLTLWVSKGAEEFSNRTMAEKALRMVDTDPEFVVKFVEFVRNVTKAVSVEESFRVY